MRRSPKPSPSQEQNFCRWVDFFYYKINIYFAEYAYVKINKKIHLKIINIFLPVFLEYVLGAQKIRRLIETVLLITHKMCFG